MEQNQHVQTTYVETKKSRWTSIKESLKKAKIWTKSYIKECHRVLQVTKKPDKEEFLVITKVSGLGLLLIGLIGFLIHLVKELLF